MLTYASYSSTDALSRHAKPSGQKQIRDSFLSLVMREKKSKSTSKVCGILLGDRLDLCKCTRWSSARADASHAIWESVSSTRVHAFQHPQLI